MHGVTPESRRTLVDETGSRRHLRAQRQLASAPFGGGSVMSVMSHRVFAPTAASLLEPEHRHRTQPIRRRCAAHTYGGTGADGFGCASSTMSGPGRPSDNPDVENNPVEGPPHV